MAVYFITGKLGGGKSLVCVKKAKDYLLQGRKVATNLDLYLDKLLPSRNRMTVYRVPDKPRLQDLELIGLGHDEPAYNQKRNGLLILDELGTWFNSRNWNDKGRQELIDFLLHIRKKRWDVMLIVQDVSLVDKQLRESLCQMMAVCKDMGAVGVPLVNFVSRTLFDKPVTMPSFHTAKVYDGYSLQGYVMDRWVFQAKELYPAYDTEQVFKHDYLIHNDEQIDMRSSYCMLSAYHLRGRYLPSLFVRIKRYLLSLFIRFGQFIIVSLYGGPARAAVGQPYGQPIKSKLVRVISSGDSPLKFGEFPSIT